MGELKIDKYLSPGQRIDLVISMVYVGDFLKDRIDVRPTYIGIVEPKKRIVVEQTTPPILKSAAGKKIEVSLVLSGGAKRRARRFGYQTKIHGLMNKYSGYGEQGVIIGYPKKGVKEASVRMACRVRPRADQGIGLRVLGVPAPVAMVDISLGGMMLSSHRPCLSLDQTISVELAIDGNLIKAQGQVVRRSTPRGAEINLWGVRFVEIDKQDLVILGKAVNEIMRSELKARSRMEAECEPVHNRLT